MPLFDSNRTRFHCRWATASRPAILILICAGMTLAGCQKTDGPASETSATAESDPVSQADTLREEFSRMLERITLSAEEREALQQMQQAELKKVEEWYATNGPTIREIQGNALDAARNRDLAKLRNMDANGEKQKIAQLRADEQKLLKTYRLSLQNALPAAAQTDWKADVISQQLLEFLSPMNLSDEQTEQIRSLAPQAINQHSGEANWSGYGTATLEKMFARQVLLPPQAAEFKALQDRHRLRMLQWNDK